jgi:hypothetical protein
MEVTHRLSEVDLQGLLEVASDILVGVTIRVSSVFAETFTEPDWDIYEANS